MPSLLPVLVGLALASADAAPPPAAPPPDARPVERRIVRVAMNDVAVDGVDPRVARVVAEGLLFELRKLERTNVISFDEVRQMLNLEAEKQAMGCESSESCLAQIADALGVDYLLLVSLARVGDTHVFGVRLLDQQNAAAAATFNKVLPAGNGVEFLGEVGPAIEALFPTVPLRTGQTRGVAEEQARRLVPPPVPPALFWSGVATSGTLLVGAAVAASAQVIFQGEYKAVLQRSQTNVESGATLVQLGEATRTAEVAGWALLGAGVVVGGLSIAMAPLTDFHGYGAE
jgi:TolB-like protein